MLRTCTVAQEVSLRCGHDGGWSRMDSMSGGEGLVLAAVTQARTSEAGLRSGNGCDVLILMDGHMASRWQLCRVP